MTKRIAVIGYHLSAVTSLADQLGQYCNVQVYSDQNDTMIELLKLNAEKYFSAYQLHVLLNRLLHLSNDQDCIICDTMFTDYGAVLAARETHLITQDEFDIYEAKHRECMESLENYDAVIYVKSSLFDNGTSFDDLPLKYAILCEEYFQQTLERLRTQLQDRFLTIGEENDNTMAKSLAMSVFDENYHQLEKSESVTEESMQTQNQTRSISILKRIKEKLPYLTVVPSKDQIKALIADYQYGRELSERLPCLSVDENECCTCLRIVIDDFGDESIECKEFKNADDAIRFFSEREQFL